MCGLTLQDFDRLRPEEFEAIMDAAVQDREQQQRGAWERMRIAAAISVQPYAKHSITPAELVPLPWDKEANQAPPPRQTLTDEEIYKRYKQAEQEFLNNGKTGNI